MDHDVDAVYTWVNSEDPAWQKMYLQATLGRKPVKGEHASTNDLARFKARKELYYSIKSLRQHASWVRNIYIVTNCALPVWANSMPRVFRIAHEALFPSSQDLPTFNSHAIETVLHHIDGLAENFIYFNDDVFVCADIYREDLFRGTNGIYFFPSKHDIPYDRQKVLLRPVDTGAINSARLLHSEFGRLPRRKLKHTQFALNKSILWEIETKFHNAVTETRKHKFRHPDDIAMATTLHAYYAAYTGRAEPKDIAARYVDIGDWRFLALVHPLSPLMRGKYTTLCLNEVTDIHHFHGLRDSIIERVMKRLFG